MAPLPRTFPRFRSRIRSSSYCWRHPSRRHISSCPSFDAAFSVDSVARGMSFASPTNVQGIIWRELRQSGKLTRSRLRASVFTTPDSGEVIGTFGLANVVRAKAVVTLDVLNLLITFVLGPACAFAVSARIRLAFVIVYLVVTCHWMIGSILPTGITTSVRSGPSTASWLWGSQRQA